MVRESGFPAASVRDDPRIATWLRKSVLAIERGLSPSDAVTGEAWRVADTIAEALHNAAEELCVAVVALRSEVPASARSDAIVHLDAADPDWRLRLPFDVELGDLRALVESVVNAQQEGAGALSVVRRLLMIGSEWRSTAELELSGAVDLRHLPQDLRDLLGQSSRMRIIPKPPLGDGLPVAALERSEDEDGEWGWELRRYVGRFCASLPLKSDFRLLFGQGDSLVTEALAFGGAGAVEEVLAFALEDEGADGLPRTLRLLGASPVRTRRPRLALAISDSALPEVHFSGEHVELGRLDADDRRILLFSGEALWRSESGNVTWRTGAENEDADRIVLVGSLVPKVREQVHLGLPQIWRLRDDRGAIVPPERVRWRTRRGQWRSPSDRTPLGAIQIGLFEQDELRCLADAFVAPPGLRLSTDLTARALVVTGHGSARVTAAATGKALPCAAAGDRSICDLSELRPGGTVEVVLTKEARLSLTLIDPLIRKALLDDKGNQLPRRSALSLDGLDGKRLVSSTSERLCLELCAADASRVTLVRTVVGEVPVAAYADELSRLLGGSSSLDAEVRLTWLGEADRAASLRAFAETTDPFSAPTTGPFAALNTIAGLELGAFSLLSPASGDAGPFDRSDARSMTEMLLERVGPGPWLIHGRRRDGGSIRPRVLPSPQDARGVAWTDLQKAMVDPDAARRHSALKTYWSNPDPPMVRDRRLVVELVDRARRSRVPYRSLDPVALLPRHPDKAVAVYWSARTFDERAAMMDLQRELPFHWCSTPVVGWIDATSDRLDDVSARLRDAGESDAIAVPSVARGLDETLSLRPELAVHVLASTLVALTPTQPGAEAVTRLRARAEAIVAAASRDYDAFFNDFVDRHADGVECPSGLFEPRELDAVSKHWRPYPNGLTDLLAAPRLAALHASGVQPLTFETIRRCRDAWVFDPPFFERTCLVALGAMMAHLPLGSRQ